MKKPITIQDYLEDIIESVNRIEEYVQGMGIADFKKSQITQDAVIRAFEVLGEATKKIPEDFRNKYPDVPWKKMAAMRDKLIHDYWGVDVNRVWKTVNVDIPFLKQQLSRIKL